MLLPRTPLTNPVRRLLRRNRLVMLEHEVPFEVEAILQARQHRKEGKQYLLKW